MSGQLVGRAGHLLNLLNDSLVRGVSLEVSIVECVVELSVGLLGLRPDGVE